jgi:hypothetical protein
MTPIGAARHDMLEDRETLAGELYGLEAQSGEVTARVRQAVDEAEAHGIARCRHHHRHRPRHAAQGRQRWTRSNNDVHARGDQLFAKLSISFRLSRRTTRLRDEIAAHA